MVPACVVYGLPRELQHGLVIPSHSMCLHAACVMVVRDGLPFVHISATLQRPGSPATGGAAARVYRLSLGISAAAQQLDGGPQLIMCSGKEGHVYSSCFAAAIGSG